MARESHGAEVRQPSLFDRKHDDVSDMRGMLKTIAVDAGGLQWLAAHLDVQPSIVSRAFNGIDGYEVNLRHLAALLDEPSFALLFVKWLCLRTGHEPPVKRRADRPAEEKLAALVKAARKAGVAGSALLDAAADELDIDKECF